MFLLIMVCSSIIKFSIIKYTAKLLSKIHYAASNGDRNTRFATKASLCIFDNN